MTTTPDEMNQLLTAGGQFSSNWTVGYPSGSEPAADEAAAHSLAATRSVEYGYAVVTDPAGVDQATYKNGEVWTG